MKLAESLVETAVEAFAPVTCAGDCTGVDGTCSENDTNIVVSLDRDDKGKEDAPKDATTTTTTTTTISTTPTTNAAPSNKHVIGWRNVFETWAVSLTMGTVFGYAAERSLMGNSSTIRSQLVFEHFPMLKMFVSAVGTSSVVFTLLHHWYPEDFNRARAARGFGDKGLFTMVVGGLMQGVGMALSGACPGMTLVQVGAGVPNALYTFLGGVLGALAYGLVHPWIQEHQVHDFRSTFKRLPSGNLDDVVKTRKFGDLALPLGVAMVGVAVALDRFYAPFAADASSIPGARTLETGLMNPVVAGVSTGMLQLPAFLVLQTFLGSSSAYSVVASQYLRVAPDEHAKRFKYMSSFLQSKASWQAWYLLGAAMGGLLSARGVLDGHVAPAVPVPVPVLQALAGGFFTVMGARVAGGCATGHGLTGLSVLGIGGWTTVPAMFAGAIATAVALSAAWGKDAFLLVAPS